MQAKFPLFSTNVGSRIKFLRELKGLTLDKLADGKPTTAQSWERGKNPRRAKWAGIAERLGLSESLIFMGRPESPEDYALIEKHRNEIVDAEQMLADLSSLALAGRSRKNGTFNLQEPADDLKKGGAQSDKAMELRGAIEEYIGQLLIGAGDDPVRLSWLLEELRIKVEEPVHWGMHERVMKQVLEENRLKDEAEARAQTPRKSHGGVA